MFKRERHVYLDHAATTPTDPRVLEAMLPYFSEVYGNPSSSHRFGREAERAIESARNTLAAILNCAPSEIIFTGCGTESDNIALRGPIMAGYAENKRYGHVITSKAEHHAVSHTAEQLGHAAEARVTWLEVTHEGAVTPQALENALDSTSPNETVIVSVMYANNEVGTVQPIRDLAAVAHARTEPVLFHTDAVQGAGQMGLDVKALGVDMMALTAHKFYGPKGVGLLYVRDGVQLTPAQTGGGQEGSRRAGTHNVPLIVGMAKALELAYEEQDVRVAHYKRLRDRLIHELIGKVEGAHLTGAWDEHRLPNHASFVIEGVEANQLLMHLDMAGVAASSGSACNTGSPQPSDVLTSMGYAPELALSSLRLTVGKQTTDADIDYALRVVPDAVQRIRAVRAVHGV
jgi:cysteine desulfurase